MTKVLDQEYWNNRYEASQTGWDLGEVSPPIKAYIDQLTNKNLRILIVGCGNAHEAQYLLEAGFTHITLLDIAPSLVEKLKLQYQDEPSITVVLGDFFEHHAEYDLIIEQTFFCAILPSMRQAHARQMYNLLAPNGKLVGVLFDCEFDKEGPPFGGSIAEYKVYFEPYFTFQTFEKSYNSASPRAGNEAFIILIKNERILKPLVG